MYSLIRPQHRFSVDPFAVDIDHGGAGSVGSVVGAALACAQVRPRRRTDRGTRNASPDPSLIATVIYCAIADRGDAVERRGVTPIVLASRAACVSKPCVVTRLSSVLANAASVWINSRPVAS